MERNPNEAQNAGFAGSAASGGLGESSSAYGGSTHADESKFQRGKDAVAEKLGAARERVGDLKSSLADKLEAGAEKLSHRESAFAGTTGTGTATLEGDGRMAAVNDKVAGGLRNTANWLRETDLASLRNDVERQVRDHPARTLLIAAGVGYLLGKAFRR
jgi:hypothetical protein